MNLPLPSAAPSSTSSSRPSHSTRLKQQLLACLDLVPLVASSIRTRPPRRKGIRNDSAPPPPRWIELNEALSQLDKSIASLKEGEWEKLGVAVPILAQLSLQLAHLLFPPTTSPRYQLLRSKNYTRSLPKDQAKGLLALLKRQSASFPAWAERSSEETHLLSPSLLDLHPLDSSLHHLVLDVPSLSPSAPSPRTVHLHIPLTSPKQWILHPPRALEKRLARFHPWVPPSPTPNLASPSDDTTSSSSVWSSHLLSSVTHLVLGQPPSPSPTSTPKRTNSTSNSAPQRPTTTRPSPPPRPSLRKPAPPLTTASKTQFSHPSSSSSSSSSSDEESLLSSSSSSSSLDLPPFTGPALETYSLHLLTHLLPSLPNLTSIHMPTPLESYPVSILGLGKLERLTFGTSERGKGAGGVLRTTAGEEGGRGVKSLVDCCVGRMLELGGMRVGDLVGWEDGDGDDEVEREGLEGVLGEHLRERFWTV